MDAASTESVYTVVGSSVMYWAHHIRRQHSKIAAASLSNVGYFCCAESRVLE